VDQEIARHFDQRAATYDRTPWVHDPAVMSTTLDFLEPAAGQRILDVGAGTGVVLEQALVACPALGRCVALDISPAMLARIRNPRIETVCHDAETIPCPDASFDTVVCRQVLHYVDNVDRCLRELRRVLADQGALAIAQMTPFGRTDEEWWKRVVRARQPLRKHDLTMPELQSKLEKAGFRISRTLQIRSSESLNSWLDRYWESQEQIAEVRRLHAEAPAAYKELHRFRYLDNDLIIDNCWTFIRTCKC